MSRETSVNVVVNTAYTLNQLTLSCPDRGWGLTEAQLIACQPHRLLAAAAALMCAVPAEDVNAPLFARHLTSALAAIATSPGIFPRARFWLAPPWAQLPQGVETAVPALDPAERGCLERPLRAAAEAANIKSNRLIAGLDVARGSSSDSGSRGSDRGCDAIAFRDLAMTIFAVLHGADAAPGTNVALPSDMNMSDALHQFLGEAAEQDAFATLLFAASAVLPAPLPLAAAALATRRLRVCANPHCANFGRAAEADLDLKQCADCRAVRYCGAECQRAHWPEHRHACAELKAAAAAAADAGTG
ncbi:hypothetical protein GPECTOR_32g519 [Gonium pectorale]|uniref:phytol kinase n=1 Tax=Gonium pectorale TaxID=33097 RepID=A0A150GDJ6_GONPE|nr:hypothetical protein GPECTOR_32g519 [Gonium pectorale]|eukprot:KXZ47906.1 hypothetical protein GPECTOR_32g519 [Gonium pectorale]